MDKCRDKKNRWRNRTIAFRMSDEENELLNKIVAATGLTKQDYIIKRLLDREIVVMPNPRVYLALKGLLQQVYDESLKFDKTAQLDDEFLEIVKFIAEILNGIKGE
ncbi:MAG: mobilization protein [Ruminococcus sp.]|nr:mobilization protein [Ruminococcus sp.]